MSKAAGNDMSSAGSTGYSVPPTPDVEQMGEFPMSQSFMNLTLEEQEMKREEWRKELAEVEYEIQTMRQVLMAKSRKSQELKRKLGITAWRELQEDITQGIRNVKETSTYHTIEEKVEEVSKAIASAPLYQKTETAIKSTAEKTTSFLGGLGSGLTAKLGAVKNSETFRSLEEKVGSAYTNVKSKVVTSRSNSSHELDEALKEAEAQREAANAGAGSGSSTATPTTTPTQTEKPVA